MEGGWQRGCDAIWFYRIRTGGFHASGNHRPDAAARQPARQAFAYTARKYLRDSPNFLAGVVRNQPEELTGVHPA